MINSGDMLDLVDSSDLVTVIQPGKLLFSEDGGTSSNSKISGHTKEYFDFEKK